MKAAGGMSNLCCSSTESLTALTVITSPIFTFLKLNFALQFPRELALEKYQKLQIVCCTHFERGLC